MANSDPQHLEALIDDEAVRARVRRVIDEPPRKGPLASIAAHPLTGTVLSFVLTGLIGWWLTTSYAANQRRQENELAAKRDSSERALVEQSTRYDASTRAVQDFARVVYDRHTRAMMLYSALSRRASTSEVVERKKQYDSAFVEWGTSHQSNLLMIRKVLREKSYTSFENAVEFKLVPILRNIDQCLTRAWDARTAGNDGAHVVQDCSLAGRLQDALDCSYAITNGLFELVSAANPLVFPDRPISAPAPNEISCASSS